MPLELKRIVKPYIILCEGKDALNFLIAYLNSTALQSDLRFSKSIQSFDFGGINDLSLFLSNLTQMEGFDKVTRLLVLRDAETNVETAIQSVKRAFSENGLPVPDNCNEWKGEGEEHTLIQTAYTLLPYCSVTPNAGTLEDLCWSILARDDSPQMKEDIQQFINHVVEKYNSVGSHEHKSRLHTYFSINKDYISFKIGEAANAGAFNWESEKLTGLKDTISNGF